MHSKNSKKLFSNLSLADYITLSRFPLAILFFIFVQNKWLAFFIFVLIALSDILDGYIARKTNKVTSYGGSLDPLADKFFLVGAFAVFLFLGKIMWWHFLLLIVRDIYSVFEMIYISLTNDPKKHKASKLGKMTTLLQNIVVLILIFDLIYFLLPLILITFILSLITIYNYASSRWKI